ncbi:MAG: acylphosphatase [Candidatus Promineifilaceae bacterium]|jgi:acylphosphatase
MNKRLEAIVTGYVQGVSFRYYTRKKARQLMLTGWVANHWDGSVRVVAEGSPEKLREFNNYLLDGPPHAYVNNMQSDWLEATGEFSTFSIRNL